MKCTIQQLDKTFMEVLNAYKNATEATVNRAVRENAKECVKELKNAHPAGSGVYQSWDEYDSGWTVMQTKRNKREHVSATVHNAEHYQLTHLLEKGHAKVNGGRTRAFPHIAPVAEKAVENLFRDIKDGV